MRTYTGRSPVRRPNGVAVGLVWVLAAATVLLQVLYPLTADASRGRLAAATVVVFCLASLTHAWVYRGFRWALLYLLITVLGGFAAEVVGTRTGWPFGDYTYGTALGSTVLGVPWVVPLAWAMMLYPTYVVVTTLSRRWWVAALVGGWSMAAWDLFLDPMMVELRAWTWQTAGATEVPGVPGIPLINFAGWFVVGAVLTALLVALPRRRVTVAQPALLYLWVYASSVLAAAAFFDRTSVAVVGGLAMGVVAVPFAARLWVERA